MSPLAVLELDDEHRSKKHKINLPQQQARHSHSRKGNWIQTDVEFPCFEDGDSSEEQLMLADDDEEIGKAIAAQMQRHRSKRLRRVLSSR